MSILISKRTGSPPLFGAEMFIGKTSICSVRVFMMVLTSFLFICQSARNYVLRNKSLKISLLVLDMEIESKELSAGLPRAHVCVRVRTCRLIDYRI